MYPIFQSWFKLWIKCSRLRSFKVWSRTYGFLLVIRVRYQYHSQKMFVWDTDNHPKYHNSIKYLIFVMWADHIHGLCVNTSLFEGLGTIGIITTHIWVGWLVDEFSFSVLILGFVWIIILSIGCYRTRSRFVVSI